MSWCAAFRLDRGRLNIAILAIDPSRRKSGGALLGDRIRMNAIRGRARFSCARSPRAVRKRDIEEPSRRDRRCKVPGSTWCSSRLRESARGRAIVPLADASLYVMTPEYGAASQLEKIDMLRYSPISSPSISSTARGPGRAAGRAQAIPAQPQALRPLLGGRMPVYGTSPRASRRCVTALYQESYPRSSSTA